MPDLKQLDRLETGVMFWAGRDPLETLTEVKSFGVRCGQIGIPGDLDLACAGRWQSALQETGFVITTVFAAFNGESYADKPTVRDTVGFIPLSTRAERERRTCEVSDFAAVIGAPAIATHIGCVPQHPDDPDHIAVREMVVRICDYAAAKGQRFALETGQESAPVLLEFINEVNRPGLGINFDPANMILYGTGDPIEALEILSGKVFSVHCKDGDWPPADRPEALGSERALGTGSVGMERFLRQLVKIGYQGPLAVEREAHDPAERLRDIRSGVLLLEELKQATLKTA
jgi:sugar phosphate isomerase/epimerase